MIFNPETVTTFDWKELHKRVVILCVCEESPETLEPFQLMALDPETSKTYVLMSGDPHAAIARAEAEIKRLSNSNRMLAVQVDEARRERDEARGEGRGEVMSETIAANAETVVEVP